eukprot:15463905-Alexandrium_andersonii.AAC.1
MCIRDRPPPRATWAGAAPSGAAGSASLGAPAVRVGGRYGPRPVRVISMRSMWPAALICQLSPRECGVPATTQPALGR